MIRVELPWPDRLLHPNARPHWAKKAKAVKSARVDAFYSTRSECKATVGWDRAKVRVEFAPPDNRRRDMDGMISSHKAAQDGIADALGVDDSKFETTYRIGAPVKGGAVIVTLEEA